MSENYRPKDGERVRVVYEGVVNSADDTGFVFDDKVPVIYDEDKDYLVSIEKIEPPVVTFKAGDVVRWHSDPPGKVVALGRTGYVELPRGSEGKYDDLTDGAAWFNSRHYEKVSLG